MRHSDYSQALLFVTTFIECFSAAEIKIRKNNVSMCSQTTSAPHEIY